MKNILLILGFLLAPFFAFSQSADSVFLKLDEALKTPDKVKTLDLSNQNFPEFPKSIGQFRNLEVLILKNDHIKLISKDIAKLKNLRVLDLSGNEFIELPAEFVELQNLEELFLNNDQAFNLEKGVEIFNQLPNLHRLHLENNNIETLPMSMYNMMQLEQLYINNNALRALPEDVKRMEKLNFIKVSENKHQLNQDKSIHDWGIKIEF